MASLKFSHLKSKFDFLLVHLSQYFIVLFYFLEDIFINLMLFTSAIQLKKNKKDYQTDYKPIKYVNTSLLASIKILI